MAFVTNESTKANDSPMGRSTSTGLKFWSFAREPLVKWHGVDPVTFPFFLNEVVFRYKNRDADLSDHLAETFVNILGGST